MSKGKIAGIIPARMKSSRFPNKPLANILGKPMIQYIWEASKKCKSLDNLYIATCDKEIEYVARKFGADVILTSSNHKCCLDRIVEASEKIKNEYVIMIQGDEPLITTDMISLVASKDSDCLNMIGPVRNGRYNHNIIKVAINNLNEVIFMTRHSINTPYRQVCIMKYHRDILNKFKNLNPSYWEMEEKIDMDRFIDNGIKIDTIYDNTMTYPVDIPEDIHIVENIMRSK